MKVAAIKHLAETYTIDELYKASQALEDGESPSIEVDGDDEGEQLTHLLASIWIKEEMSRNGNDIRAAIRAYSVRVRNSIS